MSENKKMPRYIPASDILEKEDGFYILMDMPGVDKDGLVIDLKDGELTIKGESAYDPAKTKKVLRSEFEPAEYMRTFSLTDVVDHAKIKAAFKDGVLKLHVPKAEAMKPRRIEIQAG